MLKRLFAVALALTLVLGLRLPALADDGGCTYQICFDEMVCHSIGFFTFCTGVEVCMVVPCGSLLA
jgi:hypothetical protein